MKCNVFIELDLETKLRYVKIFFDTTTFDHITKDRRVKFADIIGNIGGTMGLFTGFSIISAVELVYFGIKFICHLFKDFHRKRKTWAQANKKKTNTK